MQRLNQTNSKPDMILCCGEALIDMIPTKTIDGNEGFVPHSGGAVFNTAIALGRLNVKVGMLTGMSNDLFGQQLEKALTASHVDTTQMVRSDQPTTLAFVKITNGQASYSFYDEQTAGRLLSQNDLIPLPDHVNALYLGGISVACEPCGETYAKILTDNCHNRVVMIDPNIRSQFIADEARYRNRLFRMIENSDIVKISDEDLEWLSTAPVSLNAKIKSLMDIGPKVIILTRGAEGSTAYLKNGQEILVEAKKVDVIDTVGAGDTFNAGVLSKLSEMGLLFKDTIENVSVEEIKEALAFGARVAAVTVSRAGANPPWLDEL